jgi:transcriptional regulator with XRE-family HTH domain
MCILQSSDFKTFRKLNKMTQAEAANYFGCEQSFISFIETGKSKVPAIFISKILADDSFDKSMLRQPIAEQGVDRDDYKDKYLKEVEEHSALKSEHIAVLKELNALQKKLADNRERAAGVKVG